MLLSTPFTRPALFGKELLSSRSQRVCPSHGGWHFAARAFHSQQRGIKTAFAAKSLCFLLNERRAAVRARAGERKEKRD